MPRLRQVLTLDDAECEALSKALNSRRAAEPVVRELRSALAHPVPKWAEKLSTTVEFDHDRIAEMRAALTHRATIVGQLPAGSKRDALLESTEHAHRVLNEVAAAMSEGTT